MKNSEPLHLIIADPSQNIAEALVSELRNAGYATRAQHVDSVQALEAALARQRWDLLVCRKDQEMAYDPVDLITRVRQSDADFPILLLEDSTEIERLTAGLAIGATDVLLNGEDDRFILVLRRELENLAQRRGKRQVELAMKESTRRNQLLLDTSRTAIAYVHDGMHIYVNKAYAELFGYEHADDLAAMPLLDMITEEFKGGFKQHLKQFDVKEPADGDGFRIEGVRQDGSTFHADMSLSVATYDGEPCTQVLIRQEASRSASTREIEELRTRDSVTGLLNRHFFISAVDEAAEDAQREKGGSTLLQIELDDNQRIRQQAGLSGTDQVLHEVGQALASECGAHALLARIGDDTFAVLVRELLSRDAAAELAERIRKALQNLLASADKKTIRVTASIGVTLIGQKTGSAQEALDQAQRSIGHLRKTHKQGNAVYVFDPADFVTAPAPKKVEVDDRARETLRMLADSIKHNKLALLYQPIISLRGEELEHYEVYLRLPDKNGNLLAPDAFIQLAEQTGMGGRIDRWVVLNAIKQVSQRRAQGRDTRVTINLTYAALTDATFLPWLRVALRTAKLPRKMLILQYSETAATTYLQQARTFGEELVGLDCHLGLSHFGCSVDPFGTLSQLNVDFVKPDGSFTQELDTNPEKQGTLREMIEKLQDHGKTTVIPMVSTANALSSLFTFGANYVQGNYLGEPSPDMDFEFEGES